MTLRPSIVITTLNRKEHLRGALASAVSQTTPAQVIVMDDGSSDGTAEMVAAEFPTVELHRDNRSLGLIVRRNQAAKLASGDIIFSIDDDAAFSTPRVVERTLAEFTHPRVGAVAIPFINVNLENKIRQLAPHENGIYVNHDFIGTAHALRRDVFLQLGGYRQRLFHQGEERDYCIRMLDHGHVVRLGRADPIFHYESPRRDFRRMDLYGRRNDILFVWHNTPWPYFPLHLARVTLQGSRFAYTSGRPLRMMQGLAMGYAAIVPEFSSRKPVSRQTFQVLRSLKPTPRLLEEIENDLPPHSTI